MKRIILLSALITLAFSSINAQGVRFGIKGGLNTSSLGEYEYSLAVRENAELDNKAGVYAGLFTQIFFTPQLGLETGLFYSTLGGMEKENDHNEQYKITVNPAYLQLPLILIYKVDILEDLAIYPAVGVYGGYGLSGKIKSKGTVWENDVTFEKNYFDDFARKLDVGGSIGLNVEYRKFVLGGAYDRGFLRVNKEKIEFGDNAFNSNFRITLAYIF